jgi:stage V sporulation protein D (sporulation-specific penicillin-binding protein)
MKEETAEALLGVFTGVVDRGTGTMAALPGFRVAGKTGTAWKAREDGRGYTRNYRSSFVGMFPASDPEIVVLVMIDEPKKRGFYGGSVAAPVFNKIVRRLVHLPDGPVESIPESDDGLPLHLASIEPNTASDRESDVSDWAGPGFSGQMPRDLLPLDGRWEIERPGTLTGPGRPRVALPSVVGMSVREAVKTLAEMGIETTIVGTGYVRRQIPAPGRWVYSGDRCIIECGPYN